MSFELMEEEENGSEETTEKGAVESASGDHEHHEHIANSQNWNTLTYRPYHTHR